MPNHDVRSVSDLFSAAIDWSHDDGEGDWAAVVALQLLGSREVLDQALTLAASDDARAADILGQLGVPDRAFPEECLQATLQLLTSDTAECVLQASAVALGHLRDPRATNALARLVDHDSPDVRHAIAFALRGSTDERGIAALIHLSNDRDPDVRDWATFGLGRLGTLDTPEIRDALRHRLDDVDEETRYEALCGLARCGDPCIAQLLIDAISADPSNACLWDPARDLLKLDDQTEICADALISRLAHLAAGA
jgi:HEAT repeat protein